MQPAPIKPQVTIDDVAKLDVRIGTIVSVAEVANSRKLMQLMVDFAHWQSELACVTGTFPGHR